MLQDIAVLTGGTAIMKDLGIAPEDIQILHLGKARRIRITSEDTTIVEGGGKKRDVEARANEIRRELENTESEYDREKLEERLAKLVGGVAVIEVGAATESDMKERKSRFESAKNATRAAIEEGILPGGGVALYRAASDLEKLDAELPDERIGIDIVRKALVAPIRQLCLNDGVDPTSVLRTIRKEKSTVGYDFLSEDFVDMVEAGITDATKVVRTALQNAASVATVLLTSDALVAAVPQEDEEEDHHHHHHDDDEY
jgi:chaperonin GroEL